MGQRRGSLEILCAQFGRFLRFGKPRPRIPSPSAQADVLSADEPEDQMLFIPCHRQIGIEPFPAVRHPILRPVEDRFDELAETQGLGELLWAPPLMAGNLVDARPGDPWTQSLGSAAAARSATMAGQLGLSALAASIRNLATREGLRAMQGITQVQQGASVRPNADGFSTTSMRSVLIRIAAKSERKACLRSLRIARR